ncbi:ABC transporter ATP-binding protein [Candidatus Micrarchaeota archaeon]|nr:ABC transporter ATP-binding protein [Candidatus Micrarchaeota archaeon]MBU1930912.1 ABC transporter ATP-binding protein [Candidatus Micrarchaeota archaeon]
MGKNGLGNAITILDAISLTIKKGEFIAILGPNGCGKSTLLKLLMDLEKLEEGSISIFGKTPKEVVIGYGPQQTTEALFPWFTVTENVAFAKSISMLSMKQALNKLKEIGIFHYAQAYPYQLSGGIKQLTTIARATLNESTEVFVFDEPLSGLDYQNRLMVERELSKLRNKHYTTLMVSHDIDSAVLLSDKIIILSEKPSSIRAIIPVNLPKERTYEMRFSPAFNRISSQLHELLKADAL